MTFISTAANFRERHKHDVLVVVNTNSADSVAVGAAYLAAHRLPSYRLLNISTVTTDELTVAQYRSGIRDPVLAHLAQRDGDTIHCAVLCGPGMPLRITGVPDGINTLCVDSALAYAPTDPLLETGHCNKVSNPYFNMAINPATGDGRFYRKALNILAVCRVDGASRAAAIGLITNALAARPSAGKAVFRQIFNGIDPNGGGVPTVTTSLTNARTALASAGFDTTLDAGSQPTVYTGQMFKADWGPYSGWSAGQWASQSFLPGSIAIEVYSSSGISLINDTTGVGITRLVDAGIGGAGGVVAEPLVDAIPLPDLVFDAYAKGLSLVESFLRGTRYLRWQGFILGDPLNAPYRRGNS